MSRYVWYVIVLLSAVNVFNYMDRMALAVLAPSIKVDLQLSDSELGLLGGFAFALFYAVCGIPIARWADRGVRRNIVALSLGVWSVMTALSGAAQNFWQLFVARVGIGIGEAGGLTPAQSMLCDYVPLRRRSGVFAIHAFGLIVGVMLGMALAGHLEETIGWRWTFVALGLPGLMLALIVRLTLREPRRGFFDAVDATTHRSFGVTMRTLWRCRSYRLLMLFLVVNGLAYSGLTQWWPSLYTRVFGLNLSTAGVYVGIAIGVGSGIGLLVGGFWGDKAAQRDVKRPITISAVATSLGIVVVLASLFAPSAMKSIALISLTMLLWSVPAGPANAALYSVTMPQMRATAGALITFFQSVLGFGLGPFIVGFLSDLLAPSLGVESLRYAFLAPILLMPVSVVLLLAAAKALPHDLEAGRALNPLLEETRHHGHTA